MDRPEFPEICQKLAKFNSGAMRVYGVRRSGQHAIIDWILRNCGQKEHSFLNNRRMGQSPLRRGALAQNQPSSTSHANALAARLNRKLAHGHRPFILISYEHGFSSAHYKNGDISPGFANRVFQHEVLVTRSFSNWLPSFMRLVQSRNPGRPADSLDNSRAILKGIETYMAHIQAANEAAHPVISFDDWVTSPAYRLEKLAALGLESPDNSLGQPQPFGGGSSFTGTTQAPSPEALTNRWQAMTGSRFAAHFLQLALESERFMESLAKLYPNEPHRLQNLIAQT